MGRADHDLLFTVIGYIKRYRPGCDLVFTIGDLEFDAFIQNEIKILRVFIFESDIIDDEIIETNRLRDFCINTGQPAAGLFIC